MKAARHPLFLGATLLACATGALASRISITSINAAGDVAVQGKKKTAQMPHQQVKSPCSPTTPNCLSKDIATRWNMAHAGIGTNKINRESFHAWSARYARKNQDVGPDTDPDELAARSLATDAAFDAGLAMTLPAVKTNLNFHRASYASIFVVEIHDKWSRTMRGASTSPTSSRTTETGTRPSCLSRIRRLSRTTLPRWAWALANSGNQRVDREMFLKAFKGSPGFAEPFYGQFLSAVFDAAAAMTLPFVAESLDKHSFGYAVIMGQEWYNASGHASDAMGFVDGVHMGNCTSLKRAHMGMDLQRDFDNITKNAEGRVELATFITYYEKKFAGAAGGGRKGGGSEDPLRNRFDELLRRYGGLLRNVGGGRGGGGFDGTPGGTPGGTAGADGGMFEGPQPDQGGQATEQARNYGTYLKKVFFAARAMMLQQGEKFTSRTLGEHCFKYAGLMAHEFYFKRFEGPSNVLNIQY